MIKHNINPRRWQKIAILGEDKKVLIDEKTKKRIYKAIIHKPLRGDLSVNESVIGEHIETKLTRLIKNKEPLDAGASIKYSERKEGIKPETDIRTDRFDIAIDAMDIASKSVTAKRLELQKSKEGGVKDKAQGTDSDNNAA